MFCQELSDIIISIILSSYDILFLRKQTRGCDKSAGESGSEFEDIASPKACGNCMSPVLTPVLEEVSNHGIDLEVARKQILQ